jgi:hypothetical protein
MTRPTLQIDWNFLKNEVKLGIKFLRDYFKDKADDNKKGRIVSIIEFGPYNGLKLLVVIIITLLFLFSFSLYRSEVTFWVLVVIFIAVYDLFFGKGWVIPIIQELGKVLYEIGKDFVIGTLDFLKGVVMGTKDMLMDLLSIKKKD